jgi:hypothetical protein
MKNAAHSSATPEHGTPPEFVAIARAVLGAIDVDPASSPTWNHAVQARRVITAQENGLRTAWFAGAPRPRELLTSTQRPPAAPGTAIVNPPGERSGALVAAFWLALAMYWHRGWCRSAVWVGFNLEQLGRLQRVGAPSHPLQHVTLLPMRRTGYMRAPNVRGGQPPHSSYLTLLTRDPREVEAFAALGRELGHVVNGDRR